MRPCAAAPPTAVTDGRATPVGSALAAVAGAASFGYMIARSRAASGIDEGGTAGATGVAADGPADCAGAAALAAGVAVASGPCKLPTAAARFRSVLVLFNPNGSGHSI